MKHAPAKFPKTTAVMILWLGLAFSIACDNAERGDMAHRQFAPEQIAGWQLQSEIKTFNRQSIFDYIDGAGEVYLSFGFRDVSVCRYLREGFPEITAEIFDMGSAEDAYGVFTYARESEESGIGRGFEYRGSVLCFWQDRYYVCVTCYEQTEDTREVLSMLAEEISKRLPDREPRPELVEVLPQEGLVPQSERFFHLHSSLNYHYFVARENLLQMSPDTRAVMARYAPGTTYLLCVEYPNEQKADEGYRGFIEGYLPESDGADPVQTENGNWTSARIQGRYVTIVFDAVSGDQADELIEKLGERLSDNGEGRGHGYE